MKLSLKAHRQLLLDYWFPNKALISFLALTMFGSIAMELLNPQIIREFIDKASTGSNIIHLYYLALLLMLIVIAKQIFNVFSSYLSQKLGWKATNHLRIDLIKKLLDLDMTFHKESTSGELIERVDGEVTILFNFFSTFLITFINNFILLTGIMVLLFREIWMIGVGMSIFTVITIYVLNFMRTKFIDVWADDRETDAKFYGFIGENISGMEDIKSSGSIHYVMRRFQELLKAKLPIRMKAMQKNNLIWLFTLAIYTFGDIMAFGLSAYLYLNGIVTIGTVFLVISYSVLLRSPLEQIREQFQQLNQADSSIKRVIDILRSETKVKDGVMFIHSKGALSIKVDQVTFEYDEDSPVLKDVSFQVGKGRSLGIIGRTGSGKTTLAKLLTRLHDVKQGAIYINDNDLRTIAFDELRRRVAFVTQEVQLFSASLRNNLTLFDTGVADEKILKVIFDLGLNDWYSGLPNGLDTMMSPNGGLSAGQAQLLVFARVFIKDPDMIVLDEATARLDSITEQKIENALDKLLNNRTTIIIAHHLSTIRRVNDILVLEEGRIAEYGERSQLALDQNSRFHDLLRSGEIEEMLK